MLSQMDMKSSEHAGALALAYPEDPIPLKNLHEKVRRVSYSWHELCSHRYPPPSSCTKHLTDENLAKCVDPVAFQVIAARSLFSSAIEADEQSNKGPV